MKTTKIKNTVRKLSFIIPAMNEEKTIHTLYREIGEQMKPLGYEWEVIFIDDGSSDSTWAKMEELAVRSTLHVKAFRFGKNRGKADALALGYAKANGEIVFTMDADLQDDPKEIPRFIEKLDEGYDIVSGWKRKRYDPWHKVLPSRFFNAVISKISGVALHDHNCGFKAYKKEVVKRLPMYGDMHRMVPSIAAFKGFDTAEIEVEHHAREFGESKYGWGRILIGLMDMTTVGFLRHFRNCPMHFAGKLAMGLMFLAGVLGSVGIVCTLMGESALPCFILAGFMMMTTIVVLTQGLMLEQQVYSKMNQGRHIDTAEELNAVDGQPSYKGVSRGHVSGSIDLVA